MTSPSMDQAPVIRIAKGRPTPEELAAVTAVLLARVAAAGAAEPGPAPGVRRPAPVWHRAGALSRYRGPRGRYGPATPGATRGNG